MAPKFKYTQEQMNKAIDAVLTDGISRNQAAKQYKVPVTTLCDKLSGRRPVNRRMGAQPILSAEEEQQIVE